MQTSTSTPRAQREEEEALIVALFKGTVAIEENNNNNNNKKAKLDSQQEVNEQLLKAEQKFLSSHAVTTENVKLSDVAARFKDSAMPVRSTEPGGYVNALISNAVNDSVNVSSPVMIGHMTSSLPFYARPLSRLVTTMNQNSVKTETANTVTFLERQALAELHRVLYKNNDAFYAKYTQDAQSSMGVFTSGGTIANITGLWVARNRTLPRVDELGLFESFKLLNKTKMVVIGSELLHYSMDKALDVLGLGESSLLRIPVDDEFKVRIDLMEQQITAVEKEGGIVLSIIGLAGSTEAGSFDDLDAIAALCEKHSIHFHVDAAWGGPLMFSKALSHRLRGVEKADTVTMDGHKQLYAPMGCGLLFFKDPDSSNWVKKTAKYIIRKESFDMGKFTLEGSRPATGIHLHSNLHILGVRGYELLVDRSNRMCLYMRDLIEKSDEFELIVRHPHCNILLYRVVGKERKKQGEERSEEEEDKIDALNTELQERQKLYGRTFVSRTSIIYRRRKKTPETINNKERRIVALRVVIANPLTYEDDIDRVLADQRAILSEIMEGKAGRTASTTTTTTTTAQQQQEEEKPNNSYWLGVWESMNMESKLVFHNDFESFLSSLISPELKVEDGIKKDPRYEKHFNQNYTYFT